MIHSASGLWLTLVLALVLVSGTLTVFWKEIDWLIYSEVRVTPQETRLNPGELFDSITRAHPDLGIDNLKTHAFEPRTAAVAFAVLPGGAGARQFWIDPYSGKITGDTSRLTIGFFLNLLHTTLFLPFFGRAAVNLFGVLMIVSIVTGLITYKKFWRGFFRRPRVERNARTWLGDLHRLSALWSVWFLLIIGVTGAWWFYEDPLVRFASAPQFVPERPEHPHISKAELEALGPETPKRLSAATIVDAVVAKHPDMTIVLIRPPGNATEPWLVLGDRGEILTRPRSSGVYVNPFTGVIMADDMVSDWPAMRRVDAAMYPLHFGSWIKRDPGNFLVKLVWFIGGAIASFLAVSGLIIYAKRTRDTVASSFGRSRIRFWLAKAWRWVRPWGGAMGPLRYVNFLTIVGILSGAFLVVSLAARGLEGKGRNFEEKPVGPFSVRLKAIAGLLEADVDPIRPGRTARVYVVVANNKFDDAMLIRLGAAPASGEPGDGKLTEGSNGIASASVKLPKPLAGAKLWIEIESWDKQIFRAEWLLEAR